MQIQAAIVRERSGPFVVENVELDEPRADEIIVRVVASGLCQTDLHARDGYYESAYPAVYGHEGAGVVHAVGAAVRALKAGDHVVMSYPWCGSCANCARHMPNYCVHGRRLKSAGTRADGSTLLRQRNGAPVYSAFFQQSSFGTFALTQERYAVKVRNDAPLEQLGPLACSGQTGAGAVLNVLKPAAGDSFAVFGVGAVGLSALMAAKIAGCDPIVAVDIHDHRLALAHELCATHTINHRTCADVVGEIRKIASGGVRHAVETSAVPAVFREAVECLMPAATCVLLGSARKGTDVALEMPFVQQGRVVRGVVQGDSVPQAFIPKLVDLIMAGKFPLEKMITFYDFADIERAARESAAGTVIKPVLRMPRT